MQTKTLLGKTLAEVLAMPASEELDRIGELVVFQNDLRPKTDADLTVALDSILFQMSCENVYHFSVSGQSGYTVVPVVFTVERPYNPAYKSNYRLWAWHNRKEQDYAEALERRVAEFRMPPRPLSSCGNAMLALTTEMGERGFSLVLGSAPVNEVRALRVSACFVPEGGYAAAWWANTEPHARTLAAIVARWNEVAI